MTSASQGLSMNAVIGVSGGFIGNGLFRVPGIVRGGGFVSRVVTATAVAVIVLRIVAAISLQG